MQTESVYYKSNNNGNNKDESVVFLENEKICTDSPFENQSIEESNVKRRKTRQKKIFIIKLVAAVSLLILLAISGLIIYWALNHYFDEDYFPVTSSTETTAFETSTTMPSKPTEETFTNVVITEPSTSSTMPELTTTSPTNITPIDPLIFVEGRFNFSEAAAECAKIGRKLALKDDMHQAFESGYERCQYGWMGDRHAGYVMQESGARQACGGGRVGLISTSLKKFSDVVGGANCAPMDEQLPPDLYKLPLTNNKSVNWWVTLDPTDVYELKHLLRFDWKTYPEGSSLQSENADHMMRALRIVYPCCDFLKVSVTESMNSTYVKMRIPADDMKYLAETYKREFNNPDLKVYPHIGASFEALIIHGAGTTNKSRTIQDIVTKTLAAGVDGLIFDYEPTLNYTREHANTYRIFLDKLWEELGKHNLKLAMLVSSWGILKYYDVYSESKCEILGSMSSTYYGQNITRNIHHVNEMLKWIQTSRLHIGLGAMHMPDQVALEKTFKWNEKQLNLFLNWLDKKNLTHLHLWPDSWSNIRWIERYFMHALLNFTKD